MHRGYIKLWRKIQDSVVYTDRDTLFIWIHLLMDANYEDREAIINGQIVSIKRGQLITGRKSLSSSTGISEDVIRRVMITLEQAQLITRHKTNRYTLVSIINYDRYQENPQQKPQQSPSKAPTDPQQIPTPKALKKGNTLKNTTKTISATVAEKPIHVQFCDRFKESYETMTKQPYKHANVDFILAQGLIKQHGYETVVLKAKTLGAMCRDRSAWFTKDGWASFSIGKLSSRWNEIIPEAVPNKDRDLLEELKKRELENEQINRHINGSGKDTNREGTGKTVHA